jgi:formamidopyrimidine-DNA glycosylase
MPELPEVETVRLGLEKRVVSKKILDIEILKPKLVKNTLGVFLGALVGNSFSEISRVGKLLIFKIKPGRKVGASKQKNKKSLEQKLLLVHLKMTGQLIYYDQKNFVVGGHANSAQEREKFVSGETKDFCQKGKYTHIIFNFAGGGKLFFNDLRQFGYLKVVNEKELKKIKESFGIEPLTDGFTWENFLQIFKNRKTNIKALLLNQKVISGLGNIYVDEVLFASGVSPCRKADSLSEKEKKKIFENSEKIIARAVRYGGTTFSNFLNSEGKKGGFVKKLKIYGKEGEPCSKCENEKIKKVKLAGRGTHFCPKCQI